MDIQTKVSRVVDVIEVNEFSCIHHENRYVHRWVERDNNNNELEQEDDDEETIQQIEHIHAVKQ